MQCVDIDRGNYARLFSAILGDIRGSSIVHLNTHTHTHRDVYLREVIHTADCECDEGGQYGNHDYGNSQDPIQLPLRRLPKEKRRVFNDAYPRSNSRTVALTFGRIVSL